MFSLGRRGHNRHRCWDGRRRWHTWHGRCRNYLSLKICICILGAVVVRARPPSPPKRRECTRHSRDRGRASPSSPHFDLPAFWPTKADGGRARTMADGCDVGRREGKRPRADTLPRTGSFCDIFHRSVSSTQKQTIHSNHFTTVYDQK